MSSPDTRCSDNVLDFATRLQQLGVRLWAERDVLKYRAPRGALTSGDLELLKRFRSELVDLISRPISVESGADHVVARPPLSPAPLSFSQLAGWTGARSQGIGQRAMMRALRLRGELNVDALQRSIQFVICRHEALRTNLVVYEGVPVQVTKPSAEVRLSHHDLTRLNPEQQHSEMTSIIGKLMSEPVSLAKGDLFTASLLKNAADDHVLVVVIEHIVSDAASMNILLRDLVSAYEADINKTTLLLPQLPIQFPDYATWQQRTHGAWEARHGTYWKNRFKGYRQRTSPHRKKLDAIGIGRVPVMISRELRKQLGEWSRRHRTTLALCVLTAYAGVMLKWSQAPEILLRCQSDGREDPRVENIIGYLSSALYLRISPAATDTLFDLSHSVGDEYCNARMHADACWLETQNPQLLNCMGFNWIPDAIVGELAGHVRAAGALQISKMEFDNPVLETLPVEDGEPFFEFWDDGEVVAGQVYFPRRGYALDDMSRLGTNVISTIDLLLNRPGTLLGDIAVT